MHSTVRRFGEFEFNLRARELRKNGTRVKLQDQPSEILAMLLERPGEIAERADIQKRLWPCETLVDVDLSLNSAVRKLRQVLGDDPANPGSSRPYTDTGTDSLRRRRRWCQRLHPKTTA